MKQNQKTIYDLFPENSRVLLTGSGKEFVQRIGEDVIRKAVLGVLKGENLRTQTEYLTRSRISQINTALIVLYLHGLLTVDGFSENLSSYASAQLRHAKKTDNAAIWPAQWFLGLTGKSVQNVLKSDHDALTDYISSFESTLQSSVEKSESEFGKLKATMGFIENQKTGQMVELSWKEILQLTTAIGAQTLTIRGSDKSLYGKLFEKLILGSVLSILGFTRTEPPSNNPNIMKKERLFWLSDSSDNRESDATLLYKAWKMVRFDIGFIGPGNSEISKDKLSRFSAEQNIQGQKTYSKTFIIVDRLPTTGKTEAAANAIGAEIIQMSMKFWPKELAFKLHKTTGIDYPIMHLPDSEISNYLESELSKLNILDFIGNLKLTPTSNSEDC